MIQRQFAHHDIARYLLNNAVNGIADVLPGGDEKRADEEEDDGALVVQAKDVVVDAYFLELDQALNVPKDVKHVGKFICTRSV